MIILGTGIQQIKHYPLKVLHIDKRMLQIR